jgi:hypothetical protein
MTPREKELWKQRLACLQSISFEKVAAEVNELRWRELLCTLAAPSDADRKKMHALIKKYDAGELDRLPTDMRADGARMKRALISLHRLLGKFRDGVYKREQIAEEAAPMSLRTVARAIDDLDLANLIEADRQRERPRRYGGQGPSKYRIVWPTILDMAHSQGLQFRVLFDEESAEQGHPPAAVKVDEACRPQPLPTPAPSLPTQGEPLAPAVPQNGIAPCHSGIAPCHSGIAPCHENGPNAHAGASFPTSIQPSSPSPSAPTERAQHTPSAELHDSATLKEKEILPGDGKTGWPAAAGRLERYGVLLPARALGAARAHGWTVAQVVELLDLCEAKSIDQGPRGVVRGWGPGLVFRHLQSCPAGAAIAISLSETYRRAARDRAIEHQQRRQQAAAAASAEQKATAPAADEGAARELAFGPVLDAMSIEDRNELARATLNPFALKYFRKFGCQASGVRDLFLRELERRAATVNEDS